MENDEILRATVSWRRMKMMKETRVVNLALSLATGFATLLSNSRLTMTNGDLAIGRLS
jgi:hypothetical protein